jgi:hypothetical protein
MLVIDISNFSQNETSVLDVALTDNDDKSGKSPLEDIPYITADITTQEIVELLRESRAGI